MLSEITIENVAVMEKATAVFAGGFNALTGETGAGKSILIDSINAILGNRTNRDIIRSGAEKAAIWARFEDVAPVVQRQLAEAGYPCEDGELLLYREIRPDGKSTCRIGGMPATATMLREVCSGLISIHGQHDNQTLLNPKKHLPVLDRFAQNEVLLGQYRAAWQRLAEAQKAMDALQMDDAEKQRRLEYLRFEVEEIAAAALVPGEEETLRQQRNKVQHAQQVMAGLAAAYAALSGGDDDTGASMLLADAARHLADAAPYAPELAAYADTLNELYYTVTEMATDLQDQLQRFEMEEIPLDAIEERLDVFYRLKQKYGATTVEEVIAHGERAQEELEGIQCAGERLAQLAAKRDAAHKEAQALADRLSQSRTAAFARLKQQIADALDFLNMAGIQMQLRHQTVPLGPTGQDDVELLISTNPGEAPKPLAKIASGGELARIMLALKSALADMDEVATVIYDEIDTGISGLAAGRIGQLLRTTARGRQVICVTHTAQVAAYAQSHSVIEKRVAGGRTYTDIRPLDAAGRTEELARIISGDQVTDIARANAGEMLALAAQQATP